MSHHYTEIIDDISAIHVIIYYNQKKKGVESMPIVSKQFVEFLNAQVKYKSYSVHHKYHRPAYIKFKTYAQAKTYCIKHNLDHSSSWILTTINHC